MTIARLAVDAVFHLNAAVSGKERFVEMIVDMTLPQRKRAILDLLGHGWGPESARDWLQGAIPSWFETAEGAHD